MKKSVLTCLDCKYCFSEDIDNNLCCSIKNPNFKYVLIPVTKYGMPYSKCKKFELNDWEK